MHSHILFMSSSARVAQSMMNFPADTPARVPASPSNTARLASGVESMLKMILVGGFIVVLFPDNFEASKTASATSQCPA